MYISRTLDFIKNREATRCDVELVEKNDCLLEGIYQMNLVFKGWFSLAAEAEA